jgi:malate dehydrogenase
VKYSTRIFVYFVYWGGTMKISIIGAAGSVGAPAAFYLGARGLADEIVMIGGKKQNVLKQHAMDIGTALSALDVTVRAGDYSDMVGSDIVINAAGAPQGVIADRMEMLPKNISLIEYISEQIRRYCSDAFIITATNPVDPLNYAGFLAGGFDRRRVIGYSINDSFRFKEMVARTKAVKVSRVDGMVLGEHGSSQVLLFSSVGIDGQRVSFTEEEKNDIRSEVPNILKRYEELQAGRTAGWTCAIGLEIITRAVIENQQIVIPCSVVLDGEYGLHNISMSIPAVLGRQGVETIVELPLTGDEQAGLEKTVATLRPAMSIVEKSLKIAAK